MSCGMGFWWRLIVLIILLQSVPTDKSTVWRSIGVWRSSELDSLYSDFTHDHTTHSFNIHHAIQATFNILTSHAGKKLWLYLNRDPYCNFHGKNYSLAHFNNSCNEAKNFSFYSTNICPTSNSNFIKFHLNPSCTNKSLFLRRAEAHFMMHLKSIAQVCLNIIV